MPNWCYNFVTATGSADDIKAFKEVVQRERELAQSLGRGLGLSLSDDEIEDGFFFSVELSEETPNSINFSYETRWAPNLLDLAKVCKKFGLEAECEYNEGGMQIFGTAKIDAEGSIDDDQIPQEFLELIEYNEDTCVYTYDGEEYECCEDAIEDGYKKWKQQNF
jgi:hypothetical protein